MKCFFNAKISKFHAVAISIAHSTTQSSFQIICDLCMGNAFKNLSFEYKLGMEGEKFEENLILIPTITSSFSQHTGKPPFPSASLFFTQLVRNREEFAQRTMLPQIPVCLPAENPCEISTQGTSAGEESLGSVLALPSELHLQLKWSWIRSLKLFKSTIKLVKLATRIINDNSFYSFHHYTSNHFHIAVSSWERQVSCSINCKLCLTLSLEVKVIYWTFSLRNWVQKVLYSTLLLHVKDNNEIPIAFKQN